MTDSPAPDWLQPTANGFYCIPGDFHLDPRQSVKRAVVSHAHADHYPRGLGEVHATPETLHLGGVRYLNQAGKEPHPHAYGESFEIGGVRITFYPAGHMLGSAQVLMEYQGSRILYSGDFSLFANPTCQPLAYPPSEQKIDLLICESTFGEKAQHTEPETALHQLMEQAGTRPLLIGAYQLGKSQHLSHLLTKLYPERTIFLDRGISRYHRGYEALGLDVGEHQTYQRQAAKRTFGNFFHIVPPRVLSGYHRDYAHFKVMASGWNRANKKAYLDADFDFSDHASADEIMTYVERIRPGKVWFWHGYPGPLIPRCQALGIPAEKVVTDPES